MDALLRDHPLYTRDLRAETFMLDSSRTREFERAMGELQQGLWIVKTEERYEPTFSYRWDLLEAWLPEPVRDGRRLQREKALVMLVGKFVEVAGYADERRGGGQRLSGAWPATSTAGSRRRAVAFRMGRRVTLYLSEARKVVGQVLQILLG